MKRYEWMVAGADECRRLQLQQVTPEKRPNLLSQRPDPALLGGVGGVLPDGLIERGCATRKSGAMRH